MKKLLPHIIKFSIWTLLFIFLDQFCKYLVMKYSDFSLNAGIAFSIPLPKLGIVILTVVLLFVIFYLMLEELDFTKLSSKIFAALLIGGGIGNLIDRLRYGYVIDFIDIKIWPSFNLADVFIAAGVLLIIIFYVKIKKIKK